MTRSHCFRLSLILCAVLAAASTGHAQVIFFEDFGATATSTATPLPAGWTAIDVDGQTPDGSLPWVTDAWVVRDDFVVDVNDSVMWSTSWYAPAGTSDDWAITPQILLTANNVLEWEGYAPDPSYPDGYEVRLSTTTPTTAAMTTVLATIPAEGQTWTPRSADLSAFAGQSVYISFRNNSTDMFLLAIDDVLVRAVPPADARVTDSMVASPYTLVPQFQRYPLALGATVENGGGLGLTGVNLGVMVSQGGATVHSDSSAIGAMAPADSQTKPFRPFVPTGGGAISITYTATHDTTDDTPQDNVLATTGYVVNLDLLARDDGIITGGLGIGAGNGGEIGTTFELLKPAELVEVRSFLTGPSITETVSATVRLLDGTGGRPGTLVAISNPFTPPMTGGQAVTFTFGSTVTLTQGSYYIGVTEDIDNTLTLATTANIYTAGINWITWPTVPAGDWTLSEDFGFPVAFLIRPVLGEPLLPDAILLVDFDDGTIGGFTQVP